MYGTSSVIVYPLIFILLIIIILTCTYALSIIFISRFHTASNLLTLNVCFISCLGSIYWLIYFLIFVFFPKKIEAYFFSCRIIPYFQMVINCSIVYALLMITINRFVLVIYPNKGFLKCHKCIFISIFLQWIVAFILPLPLLIQSTKVTMISLWLRIYQLIILVILPSFLNGLFNILILKKVRLSIRRLGKGIVKSSVNNLSTKCLNSRDVCLLKHMLFIHIVFVIGWLPINLLFILQIYVDVSVTIYFLVHVLPALTLLINILDLYLFNREVRQHLKEKLVTNCSSIDKNSSF